MTDELSEERIAELASEAERGYDVSRIRPGGTPWAEVKRKRDRARAIRQREVAPPPVRVEQDMPSIETEPQEDLVLLRRAIADPGAFVPRGNFNEHGVSDYSESISAWGARAVKKAFSASAAEQPVDWAARLSRAGYAVVAIDAENKPREWIYNPDSLLALAEFLERFPESRSARAIVAALEGEPKS